MIVSFHPIIEADLNRICAGRLPDNQDLAAMQQADALILPQGCSEPLYRLAKATCAHIFPNLDARFAYAGKLRQIQLFRQLGLAHPATDLYADLAALYRSPSAIQLPAVLKLDWGGQGDTVFLAHSDQELADILARVEAAESTGQSGFLFQQFIPTQQRSLRVAVIGTQMVSYWRIQTVPHRFGTSIVHGARIDHHADPILQTSAKQIVAGICAQTGLQLAGFDFIFDQRLLDQQRIEPLILEINFFFGRAGLGGSSSFYRILEQEVDLWLAGLRLRRHLWVNGSGK